MQNVVNREVDFEIGCNSSHNCKTQLQRLVNFLICYLQPVYNNQFIALHSLLQLLLSILVNSHLDSLI